MNFQDQQLKLILRITFPNLFPKLRSINRYVRESISSMEEDSHLIRESLLLHDFIGRGFSLRFVRLVRWRNERGARKEFNGESCRHRCSFRLNKINVSPANARTIRKIDRDTRRDNEDAWLEERYSCVLKIKFILTYRISSIPVEICSNELFADRSQRHRNSSRV